MVLLAGFMAVSAGTARAFEASGEGGVDILTNYVWRGQNLVNDGMVLQPTLGITTDSGFGMNFWANYVTKKVDDTSGGEIHESGESTETDLTLNYGTSRGKVSLEVGYIHYDLKDVEDTQEVYFTLSYDTFLSPSLTYYHDFDEGNGGFLVASVGHSFGLPREMSLDLGASASYNFDNEIMGVDEDGDEFTDFYNGEVSAALNIPVTKNITIVPKLAYSFPLSNDADDAIEAINDASGTGTEEDVLYGGVGVYFSF
ncbi:MAG: TorF family putative porin [Thermodesulfobacteriota bacterium]